MMNDILKCEDLARAIIKQQEEIEAWKAKAIYLEHALNNAIAEIQKLNNRKVSL